MVQSQQDKVDTEKEVMDDILKELSCYFGDLKSIKITKDKNIITGAKASILKREIKVGNQISKMNGDQLKAVMAHELSHGWIKDSKFSLRWIGYMGLALLYLVSIILSFAIVFFGLLNLPLNNIFIALTILNIVSRLSARGMRGVEIKCDKDVTLAMKSRALADALDSFQRGWALEYVENRATIVVKALEFITDLIQCFFGYLHPNTYVRIEMIKKISY